MVHLQTMWVIVQKKYFCSSDFIKTTRIECHLSQKNHFCSSYFIETTRMKWHNIHFVGFQQRRKK
jgi:hypothetical protein